MQPCRSILFAGAVAQGLEAIVTHNLKVFLSSIVPGLSIQALLQQVRQQKDG